MSYSRTSPSLTSYIMTDESVSGDSLERGLIIRVLLKLYIVAGCPLCFWSCISNNILGPLIEVNTRLDSSKYISNILVPFLQTFWKNFMRRKPQAKFMQDNAPCHKSKKVLSWFGSKKVSILVWPPQSPDLNPIENLWAILFSAVREKHEQKIDTLQELRVAIKEEWQKIPREILQRLYASIPLRLKEVKKAKGNATKY